MQGLLNGLFDPGFGFSNEEICNTLPVVELSYSSDQRFLDDQQKLPEAAVEMCSSGFDLIANRKIYSPGPPPCPHCKGNNPYSCSTHYLCKSCNHCWKKSNTISYDSNLLNNSPAEYFSSAWLALDSRAIMNRTVCVDMVHGDDTTTMNLLSQAHRMTDQWMKVGETVLGTSPSAGYASSSSQAKFPFDGNASVCIDVGSNLNDIHGDGTATMDPILQERPSTDQLVKGGETVLGTSPSAGYASSSSQAKFPFDGNASVCIDVGSNLNDIHGDGTATMDPTLQERPSTDQWVKLAEIVLAISAPVAYNCYSHFPKAANAVGFIASLTAISLRSKWQTATRVLAKFGAIACAAGTLVAIGNDLPEEYKWIGTVAFLFPAMAVLFA